MRGIDERVSVLTVPQSQNGTKGGWLSIFVVVSGGGTLTVVMKPPAIFIIK
jgi:hypothetical protein